MKTRLIGLFILVVGLAFALTWSAAAQGAGTRLTPPRVGGPGGRRSLSPQQATARPDATPAADHARVTNALRSSPVMFIENVGQFAEGARFQVRGGDRTIWLAEDSIWISVVEQRSKGAEEQGRDSPLPLRTSAPSPRRSVNLKLTFPGANPHPRIEPFERLDTVVSYFIGHDPAKWHPDVPVWGGVRYVDLYPGVDLEIIGQDGRWAWRLVMRSTLERSNVERDNVQRDIRLRIAGAGNVAPSPVSGEGRGGGLLLTTAVGDFTLPLPTVEGLRVERSNVAPTGVQRLDARTFDVSAPFSRSAPLQNPKSQIQNQAALAYAGFLGGSGEDEGEDIAVDGAGNAYVTGYTRSGDFPAVVGPDLSSPVSRPRVAIAAPHSEAADASRWWPEEMVWGAVRQVNVTPGVNLGMAPLPGSLRAQTEVCGAITDTHWTLAGSPYVITCNASLNSGTLLIDPGVSVRFQPGIRMDLSATLLAEGTKDTPVVFTSNKSTPARGDWSGLHLRAGSSNSVLRHIIVEYGTGISVQNASPLIDHATIRYNASSGIYLSNSRSTISHSTIFSNTASSGAGVHIRYGRVTLDSNTISWNSATTRGGGVHAYGWTCCATVTVTNNVIVHNSVGSYGGAGILFDSANGLIANNTIADNSTEAGSGGGLNISGASGPRVTLQNNVIVRNSAAYVGGVDTDAYTTITGNLIANNASSSSYGGLNYHYPSGWHGPSSLPVTCNTIVNNTGPAERGNGIRMTVLSPLHRNTIYGNSGFQFRIATGRDVDATENYWGTTDTGQIAAGIYDNSDDPNLGVVSFSPFLGAPDTCAPPPDGRAEPTPTPVPPTLTPTPIPPTPTPLPPSGKPVVVLVPGWQGLPGSKQMWCSDGITRYPDNQNFRINGPADPPDMPDWLTQDGFEVWSAHLTTGPAYTAPLRVNAACLKSQLDQVRDRAPKHKVILIAHSMGGLVARAYMEKDKNDSLYQDDVKELFTLGSPHKGVPLGLPVWLNKYLHIKNLTCDSQPAMCEFTQGIADFNRNHANRARGADYYLVGGDLHFFDSTWKGRVMSALIWGADDGIVPTASGLGLNGRRQALQTDEAHIKDLGHFSYFFPHPGDRYSFAYADCIQPVLQGNRDGCKSSVAASAARGAEPSFSAVAPIAEGTLSSGQQVTQTVSLDGGGSALFAASWVTGTITFTLTGPGGQPVDSAYASAHPAQVSYLPAEPGDTPLGASYTITTTEAGLWTMNLQAGSVPSGTTDYTLLVAMDSPITLTVQTDRRWYAGGQVVTITATLGGGVTATGVTAQIQRPDGVTDTLSLTSAGGGLYQGTYTVPATPGYVTVEVVADGNDSGGRPFSRQAVGGFQIASPAAALGGSYADRAEDSDGDGLYEALAVDVGVTTNVSGTFSMAADLMWPGDGTVVARTAASGMLVTGTHTVTLRFDGDDIRASGLDGPYQVTSVLLLDERGATLPVQEATDVWTTAAYKWTDFGTQQYRIYLPLVVKM